MNDTSATLAGIATDVSAGSAEALANHVNQQCTGSDMGAHGFAVQRK
jgi:hypothetical protein